jgi:transposase InsO family protein
VSIEFVKKLYFRPTNNSTNSSHSSIAKAVPEMSADVVSKFLYEEILMNYGAPYEIITDRGKSFLAEAIIDFERRAGISHIASTPYHPQTNGMVERMHAMLNNGITHLW